jgi:hypothetical protein
VKRHCRKWAVDVPEKITRRNYDQKNSGPLKGHDRLWELFGEGKKKKFQCEKIRDNAESSFM